jgi:hypothetical protein
MPYPLVILEHHFTTGPRKFITENAHILKKMGYTKFLIELNSEIPPEVVKQQLRMILSNPAASAYHISSKALLDMLTALEKNHIPYEFIDPETQEEANKQNIKLKQAAIKGNLTEAMAYRQQLTDARDDIMAPKLIKESALNNGGVVFLVGFCHKNLVKLLELERSNYFRYAMFVDSSKDQISYNSSTENSNWNAMPDEDFRTQFYNANIRFIDLATKPSFELIEAECKLMSYKVCDKPAVGEYLSKATKQEYNFTIDDHFVVTASTSIEKKKLQETVVRIKKDFPGLRFFTEQRDAQTFLNIPGINLPENNACLKEGFIKLGVMKP